MALRVTGINELSRRVHYRKWSRNFMDEQAAATKIVRKALNDNPFNGLFGGKGSRLDKMLQRFEKSFW